MNLFTSSTFPSYVEVLMRRHRVPGLSIALVQEDRVESAGYGMSSLETSESCTPDTLFDIGSSSKSLTAAAVALLVDDDSFPEVQYDAIMSELLPKDFIMASDEHTKSVTLDNILGHTTGLPGHDNSYMGPQAAHPDDAQSITRNLRNLPLAAPPGSRHMYCNMMYTVATHLVEVKSKQSFSEFLQERIFAPLHMESTCLQPESARIRGLADRMANGHIWDYETKAHKEIPIQDCPEGQGAGSVISSAKDFIQWIKAFMNRESPINQRVFDGLVRQRSSLKMGGKPKPHTTVSFYAGGVEVYNYREHMVVWHNGFISGFASCFFFLPDLHFGAVILGNADGANGLATILAQEFIEDAINLPEESRKHRKDRDDILKYVSKKASAANPRKGTHGAGKNSRAKKEGQVNKEEATIERDAHAIKGEDEGNRDCPDSRPSSNVEGLKKYVGRYWHPGYHTLTVEIRGNGLFVDAADRSMGFTLTFEQSRDKAGFTVYLSDTLEGGNCRVEAKFVLEDERVAEMGLELEPALEELIWFKRMDVVEVEAPADLVTQS